MGSRIFKQQAVHYIFNIIGFYFLECGLFRSAVCRMAQFEKQHVISSSPERKAHG